MPHAAPDGRFRCLDLAAFAAGADVAGVCARTAQRAEVLEGTWAAHLLRCNRFRTLTEHAGDLSAVMPGADPAALLRGLSEAAAGGLLLSEAEVRARLRLARGVPPPKVAVHGMVTRQRTESALRALAGFVDNASRHGRAPEFLVMDDSAPAAHANLRDGLRALGAKAGGAAKVRLAGRHDKDRFAARLAAHSGVALDLVRFALRGDPGLPWPCGANRNALLLACAGGLFVSTDDDIFCAPARLSQPQRALRFSAGEDPTQIAFFDSPTATRAALRAADLDALGLHEDLLGQGLGACLAPHAASSDAAAIDLDGIDGRVLALLTPAARVRLTQLGLYGDSGMGSPTYYLGLEGDSRDRFLAAPEEAWRSRQIMRGVSCPTVSAGSYFMTYAFGCDARAPIPPFLPVLRNEDGIFSTVLRLCDPDSYVGHVPVGLWHEPVVQRSFAADAFSRGAGQAHGHDVVLACLGMFRSSLRAAPARLAALGAFFCELGSWPLADFEHEVRLSLVRARCQRAAYFEELLSRHGGPPGWVGQVRGLILALRESLSHQQSFIPADLRLGGRSREARPRTQALIGRFGALLLAWPALWASALSLRQVEPLGRTVD